MELLRRILFTVLVCSFTGQINNAQDFNLKRDAFLKSYNEEEKKQYPAAINSLKAVYDEKSYEINLRLGWLN
ncbi:MAG TPA: hypothetical protein PK521_15120, partial [Bacteroidales bacterium]|nr:hypothetical protein [Bacteroidales bacterium]